MGFKNWNWVEHRKNENYLEDYRTEKKQKIQEIVRRYTIKEGGIIQRKLLKEINLDRKNVKPSIDELIKEGLIKKDGFHGKYSSTEKSFDDPLLFAYFFADLFRKNLLKQENLITTKRRLENPFYCIDFTIYRQYFQPKFTKRDKLEHTLFEFSNRIGAFITYVLIQAMNSDAYNINLKSSREFDQFVTEWVHKAVLRALPFIIWQFRDSVYKGINQYPRNYHEHVNYMEQGSKFIMSTETINNVTSSFARIYPLVFYEFERIFQNLSSEVESYKLQLEEIREKKEEQEKCEHQFSQPIMTIYGSYARQCAKCNYFKKVKESAYRVVSELETALNDFWKIEKVKPDDFKSNTKLSSMVVTLSSQTGEPKTIRAVGEEEVYALRDFLIDHQKDT
jgi:predicted transcriptional regulator